MKLCPKEEFDLKNIGPYKVKSLHGTFFSLKAD